MFEGPRCLARSSRWRVTGIGTTPSASPYGGQSLTTARQHLRIVDKYSVHPATTCVTQFPTYRHRYSHLVQQVHRLGVPPDSPETQRRVSAGKLDRPRSVDETHSRQILRDRFMHAHFALYFYLLLATIPSVFQPAEGQGEFDYVFDFTGEVRYDRTEVVRGGRCWIHVGYNSY